MKISIHFSCHNTNLCPPVACDQTTYEYLQKQSHSNIAKPRSPKKHDDSSSVIEVGSDTDEAPFNLSDHEDESDAGAAAESDNEGDKFKIVLRSALTANRNITLTVRPTTTCGAIVKAFLKKAGLADNYPTVTSPNKRKRKGGKGKEKPKEPKLEIDGDKLADSVQIGDMDLEDGDMVDVVGL